MFYVYYITYGTKSLPVRGAWVEINGLLVFAHNYAGRSPCGERGLKFCKIAEKISFHPVAPRAGSVG